MAVHFGGDLHGKAYYDATGFPDLLLIHAERNLVWFRELKSRTGKLTERQLRWQDRSRLDRHGAKHGRVAPGGPGRTMRPAALFSAIAMSGIRADAEEG